MGRAVNKLSLSEILHKELHVRPEENKPLGSLSTLGVGGWAECFVEPQDLKDCQRVFELRSRWGFPIWILGGGSNVVFADGSVAGVVLSTRRLDRSWWPPYEDVEKAGVIAELQSGCLLSLVVERAAREGLGGMEFALGIPGTIGGALAGNAGTGGRSIGDLLEEVTSIEEDGSLRRWLRGEFSYAYRRLSLADGVRFLASCKLHFLPVPYREIEHELKRFRELRSPQPRGVRSAGCTFKNPPGDSAGRILDECGCKGMRVGGAVVSSHHANFILNEGNASGSDVLELARRCRDKVYRAKSVLLLPEIKFLGFGEGVF
ncbi:MAG: UDP-N-acetylmuramate dehydrogenase [Fretibacterium sp.]|nr:UDP-N-acetylmuramate dehydrogenase [Fretibacterium sp.]